MRQRPWLGRLVGIGVVGERLVAPSRGTGSRPTTSAGSGAMSVPNSTRSGQRSMNAARRVRLAAQLADPRRDVHVEVRAALEDRRDAREVLGGAADVRADERRRRMAHDDRLEAVDELVERREAVEVGPAGRARRPEVPVGVLAELLPALVLARRAARRRRPGRRRGS